MTTYLTALSAQPNSGTAKVELEPTRALEHPLATAFRTVVWTLLLGSLATMAISAINTNWAITAVAFVVLISTGAAFHYADRLVRDWSDKGYCL